MPGISSCRGDLQFNHVATTTTYMLLLYQGAFVTSPFIIIPHRVHTKSDDCFSPLVPCIAPSNTKKARHRTEAYRSLPAGFLHVLRLAQMVPLVLGSYWQILESKKEHFKIGLFVFLISIFEGIVNYTIFLIFFIVCLSFACRKAADWGCLFWILLLCRVYLISCRSFLVGL